MLASASAPPRSAFEGTTGAAATMAAPPKITRRPIAFVVGMIGLQRITTRAQRTHDKTRAGCCSEVRTGVITIILIVDTKPAWAGQQASGYSPVVLFWLHLRYLLRAETKQENGVTGACRRTQLDC